MIIPKRKPTYLSTASLRDGTPNLADLAEIDVGSDMLIGVNTGGVEAIELGTGLVITGGTIDAEAQDPPDGVKGDIDVSVDGTVWTIVNDAVTYAKMQDVSAASKLLGRGDSGAGSPQEITLGSGLAMSGTTLNSSGGTVSSVASADGSITVTNPTTTVDLAVVKAPILTTARTIGGVSFNGSANIVPQTIQSINEATDTTCFPLFITASGSQSLQPMNNTSLTFNSNTGNLGATVFTGNLTGNVTGNTSGSSGSCTGNAATATALQTPRTIGGVSFNGSADIVPQTIQSINEATDTTCFPLFITNSGTQSLQPMNNTALTFNSNTGNLGATTFTGAFVGNVTGNASGSSGSCTGNALTATTLQNARNIDGQSFNGSANITVIAPGTHAASTKATPVDADEIPLADSAASFVLKNLTWANVKATLKTYFDTLYQVILVSGTNIKTINGSTVLGSGDLVVTGSQPDIPLTKIAPATSQTITAGYSAYVVGPYEIVTATSLEIGAGRVWRSDKMAEGLLMTKSAAPATPATNKSNLYIDTTSRYASQIDDNGVISILNNDGLQDRNIITNGGFNIQQRVATASTAITGISTTTRAGVVSDCWSVTTSVASNLNWAQIDTAGAQDTGLQSRYYGSIISSTAGKKVMLSQWILGSEMAHLRGQKVRLSIKHNQKVGSGQTYKLGLIQLNVSGTVDVSPAFLSGAWSTTTGVDPAWGTNLAAIAPDASPTGENGTINGSYLDITTVSVTWTRSSCVFTVPSNAKNLVVVFFSNATGGTTDNISISEIQLTQDATIVNYVEPPLAETLIRCQRRYCKSFPLTVVPAASVSEATGGSGATGMIGKAGATALAANYSIQFPVQMWKVPTVTYFTPTAAGAQCWRFSGAAAAAQTATASRASSVTDRAVVVTATGDAAGTVGDLVGVHFTADAEIVA